MLHQPPLYVSILFVLTTFLTLFLLLNALRKASASLQQRRVFVLSTTLLLVWFVVQAVLSLQGVYSNSTDALPPRLVVLGIAPVLLVIAGIFATAAGRKWIAQFSLARLTWLHVVRLPVELVLFSLATHKAVPALITFEGMNFDILAGITAPLIAYYGFTRKKLKRGFLLMWNVVCLLLLLNVVVLALLSAPSPLQQFSFDQPNIAVLYFPFSWLPTFVVPAVLFSHLIAIVQLSKPQKETTQKTPQRQRAILN